MSVSGRSHQDEEKHQKRRGSLQDMEVPSSSSTVLKKQGFDSSQCSHNSARLLDDGSGKTGEEKQKKRRSSLKDMEVPSSSLPKKQGLDSSACSQSVRRRSINNNAQPTKTAEVEPENDADLETQISILKEEDNDFKEEEKEACCSRCTSEWKHPGWFSIQDKHQVLDIPASFGPSSWHARLIKLCLMVWFNATLIYTWVGREHAGFFLAYLTNWSLLFSSLWLIVSFINSLFPPTQPRRPSDPVSLWIKFSWLLFTCAAHFTVVVVILYWSLDYTPGESSITYMNLFIHGGVLLIWPEGLILNRIPIRWKHLPLVMLGAACYVAWLVIHQVTDMGVHPYKSEVEPDASEDLLYPAIDFEENTAFSSVLCVMVIFVLVPLVHWLLWCLSVCGLPCKCGGYNRRYVPQSGSAYGPSPGEGELTAISDHVTNI